jgi:hypothetical protein
MDELEHMGHMIFWGDMIPYRGVYELRGFYVFMARLAMHITF